MDTKLTYTTEYDRERNIGRIEVFNGGLCIASRIVHDLAEVERVLNDFDPLLNLSDKGIWGIVQSYSIKGLPAKSE